MNAVIVACSSMEKAIAAAQRAMRTNYPVVLADRTLHEFPKKMQAKLTELIAGLESSVDTVLMAMGFCGGSLEGIETNKRLVAPRVDDCITLMLTTSDEWCSDLKEAGHFYLRDSENEKTALTAMQARLCERYGTERGKQIFNEWFAPYQWVDIIDTGTYDCYAPAFRAYAEENAKLIGATVRYVKGSNRLLEKLVAGQWDEQFVVAAPGQKLYVQDFS